MKRIFISTLILFCLNISSYILATQNEMSSDPLQQYDVVRGSEQELLSYYNDSRNYRHMVFLNFELTDVPQTELIEQVKLKMYGLAELGGGINTANNQATPVTHSLAVYNMNSYNISWNEASFMYNNWNYSYGYAKEPSTYIALLENVSGEGWFEWDITDCVKSELSDNGIEKLALSICDTYVVKTPEGTNTNSYVRFHSKENSSGNKPFIEFTVKGEVGINACSDSKIKYNLSGNVLTISDVESYTNILISDVSGNVISNSYISKDNTYSLPSKGVYILLVKDEANTSVTKILVQ